MKCASVGCGPDRMVCVTESRQAPGSKEGLYRALYFSIDGFPNSVTSQRFSVHSVLGSTASHFHLAHPHILMAPARSTPWP